MKKFLLTAIVALSAATAGASDYIEHKIYSDKNFEQNRAKAVKMLEQRGYQVHDVDADSRRGQPVLDIEAFNILMQSGLSQDFGVLRQFAI